MCSKRKNSFFQTLAFRLTLLYSVIFVISTVLAFWIISHMTSIVLRQQMDEDLFGDTSEFATVLRKEGIVPLKVELQEEAAADGVDQVFFRLFDRDGKLLFTTDMTSWGITGADEPVAAMLKNVGDHEFLSVPIPGEDFGARSIFSLISEEVVLQIGESSEEDEEYLVLFYEIFGKTMILIIIVSALTGWFLARRALSGVEEVTQAAIRISRGDLDKRVPAKSRGNEIERLATAFNYMIDRIQSLLNGIREVTDNIAHDLKTPLTRIRGNAETTILTADSMAEFQDMAGDTVAECDSLLGMINDMLDISETEAGAGKMDIRSFDLTEVMQQACDLYLPLAEEKDLSMSLQAPVKCLVQGDMRRIQRLVSNLLDNAMKYTPSGGSVDVSLSEKDDRTVEIIVQDTGVGISDRDLPHIFQRFYRCDQSRSEDGSGLGLSLAMAIVSAHGGSLDVSSHPGSGSCFVATLPASR